METNEWKEELRKLSSTPQDFMVELMVLPTETTISFIEQNFILISELKSWVEENEKEDFYDCGVSNERGYNSALKELSDRFIKE